MSTADERIASDVDQAMATAQESLQAIDQALVGAGQEAHAAWRAISRNASALPAIADTVRAQITAIAADEALALDYRRRMINELNSAATTALLDEHERLQKSALPQFEALLGELSLPAPSKDTGTRSLVRQAVSNLVQGVTGNAFVGKAMDALGQNPAWDAELLSDDWGRALFVAAGATKEWANFRKAAIGKLLGSPHGTPRELANRKALSTLYQRKVRGQVAGLYQLSKLRLGSPR